MSQHNGNREDRRSRYTRMVVKEALLTLLSEKDYGNITVSDICRTAEISRGTFYLHYSNIPAVLSFLRKLSTALIACWRRSAVKPPAMKNAGFPYAAFFEKTKSTSRCFFQIRCTPWS